MITTWNQLPDQATVDATIKALKKNGINATSVATAADAKKQVIDMVPADAEVMTMVSMTLEATGIAAEMNESGRYSPVREKLNSETVSPLEKKKLGAGPDWAIGSVHAVTEQGQLVIASNSGSQLPAYAYGAMHVIWVVGAQKIVTTLDQGIERIYQYVLPLESERARQAYGDKGSNVSKLLIINKENNESRLHLIFVNEVLGF